MFLSRRLFLLSHSIAKPYRRVFFEVSREYPYSQFGLLSGEQGAQFLNPPIDRVLLQPQLLQVQSPIGSGGPTDTTAERSREKAVSVLRTAAERLAIRHFLNCGIKVQAQVPAPEGGAREYVATNLFHQADRVDLLGNGFFGGGRCAMSRRGRGDRAAVEPP